MHGISLDCIKFQRNSSLHTCVCVYLYMQQDFLTELATWFFARRSDRELMSIFSLVISLMVAVFACVALATVVWWFSRPHLAGPSNREYTQRFQQEREKVCLAVRNSAHLAQN